MDLIGGSTICNHCSTNRPANNALPFPLAIPSTGRQETAGGFFAKSRQYPLSDIISLHVGAIQCYHVSTKVCGHVYEFYLNVANFHLFLFFFSMERLL
jgi:hypothetical protein